MERDKIFFEIINHLNEAELQGLRILYDCVELGIVLISWYKSRWNSEWFDEAKKWKKD